MKELVISIFLFILSAIGAWFISGEILEVTMNLLENNVAGLIKISFAKITLKDPLLTVITELIFVFIALLCGFVVILLGELILCKIASGINALFLDDDKNTFKRFARIIVIGSRIGFVVTCFMYCFSLL